MLFKCKLQNYGTCAAGFFMGGTVPTGLTATDTDSLRWHAATAAPCAPPWGGCPCACSHREQKAACLPLPCTPALAAGAQSMQGPAEGSGKHHRGAAHRLGATQCSSAPAQPHHPNQLRLILLSAAHAS